MTFQIKDLIFSIEIIKRRFNDPFDPFEVAQKIDVDIKLSFSQPDVRLRDL